MARYSPEHKEATRRRMLEAAGRRFKSDGIDGSGIATLVADAGLTNGAFYGHFASKDDLVASVVARQLEDQVAVVNSLPAGLASVEAFVREYLSPAHRDDLAGGCPSAALLDEIGRCDVAVREAYTDGASSMIRAIARRLAASLQIYVRENRSRVRAAAALSVHPNTVSYRVRQAEELLGRSIDENSLELSVALTLLPVLGRLGANRPKGS